VSRTFGLPPDGGGGGDVTQGELDAVAEAALLKAANLSDLEDVAEAKANLSLAKADVGLGNVDNTSDVSKPVSTAAQTALDLKAPLASPTFSGTVAGVTKGMVGLGNVDNTADSAKPVSTAQATADGLRVLKAGDTMTGILSLPAGGAAVGGLIIGGDCNLYRSAANVLKTDDSLDIAGNLTITAAFDLTGQRIRVTRAAGVSAAYDAAVTGDTAFGRFYISADGGCNWGDGTAIDTTLRRSAANTLATDDDFAIVVAGKGLKVKEGSNAKMGTATLVAGTATVATTAVTANSRIFLTAQSLGTVAVPQALAVTARTAATSFVITSADATDTSVIAWHMIEPA
jgi:hypothetical protein